MSLPIKEALDLLNFHLKKLGIKRTFTICGGASLILQGISTKNRATQDVDVVAPEIDQQLREASVAVAEELQVSAQWLNSDVKTLSKDLDAGWQDRSFQVYSSSNLTVLSISRSDLIFSKFYAYCDRQQDIYDLIDLRLTDNEIDAAAEKTKLMDGNPLWPQVVESQKIKLLKKIKNE